MLRFRIQELILSRGETELYKWPRRTCKLSSNRARQIRKNTVHQLRLEEITALCIHLHCTPNELFSFDNKKLKLAPTHPLMQLVRDNTNTNLQQMLKEADTETQEEVMQLLRSKKHPTN